MAAFVSATRNLAISLLIGLAGLCSAHAETNYKEAQLSPDGTKLAVSLDYDKSSGILILSTADFSNVGGVELDDNQSVGQFYWVNKERLVMEVLRQQPWQDKAQYFGELYATNFDGSRQLMVYGLTAGENETGKLVKRREYTDGWADVISLMPGNDREILISSTPMAEFIGDVFDREITHEDKSRRADVQRLDVYQGKLYRSTMQAPFSYARFLVNAQDEVVLAYYVNDAGKATISKRVNDQWQPVNGVDGRLYSDIALLEDGVTIMYTQAKGDSAALVKFNTQTGKQTEIVDGLVVSAGGLLKSLSGGVPYAVRFDEQEPVYGIFNEELEEAQVFSMVTDAMPGYEVSLTSRSADGVYWTIKAGKEGDKKSFYLLDRQKNKLSSLTL